MLRLSRRQGLGVVLMLAMSFFACTKKPSDDPDDVEETHGGDLLASAFRAKSYQILAYLLDRENRQAIFSDEEMARFEATVQSVRVASVDGPLQDSLGRVVDARTGRDPQNRKRMLIELDRDKWQKTFKIGLSVNRLVFHELLWAMEEDDADYRISLRLNMPDEADAGLGSWRALATVEAPRGVMLPETMFGFDAVAGHLVLVQRDYAAPECTGAVLSADLDLETNTWQALTAVEEVPNRDRMASTVVGDRLFVWGGCCSASTCFDDGYLYDPRSRSWDAINGDGAPRARSQPVAIAAGGKILVMGGVSYPEGMLTDGGLYDVATNRWEKLAEDGAPPAGRLRLFVMPAGAVEGERILVFRQGEGQCVPDRYVFDPMVNRWQEPLPGRTTGCLDALEWDMAAWSGTEMFFLLANNAVSAGGEERAATIWDPIADTWRHVTAVGAPSGRAGASVVWTGRQFITFGGRGGGNHGAVYDGELGVWRMLAGRGVPEPRLNHFAFWNQDAMVVWGGLTENGVATNSGAVWK